MQEPPKQDQRLDYAHYRPELRRWHRLVVEFLGYVIGSLLPYILLAILVAAAYLWRWLVAR